MTVCTTGQVRLVGGANSSEGRVETCLNGHWGKVRLLRPITHQCVCVCVCVCVCFVQICDDSWDDNAAKVVCGQLKLPTLGEWDLLLIHSVHNTHIFFLFYTHTCMHHHRSKGSNELILGGLPFTWLHARRHKVFWERECSSKLPQQPNSLPQLPALWGGWGHLPRSENFHVCTLTPTFCDIFHFVFCIREILTVMVDSGCKY